MCTDYMQECAFGGDLSTGSKIGIGAIYSIICNFVWNGDGKGKSLDQKASAVIEDTVISGIKNGTNNGTTRLLVLFLVRSVCLSF